MDGDLYDEFGNYIGPDLDADEDVQVRARSDLCTGCSAALSCLFPNLPRCCMPYGIFSHAIQEEADELPPWMKDDEEGGEDAEDGAAGTSPSWPMLSALALAIDEQRKRPHSNRTSSS
jgi:hypothetical protein